MNIHIKKMIHTTLFISSFFTCSFLTMKAGIIEDLLIKALERHREEVIEAEQEKQRELTRDANQGVHDVFELASYVEYEGQEADRIAQKAAKKAKNA